MGCRGLAWDEPRAAAFRWLARQEPPLIVAPEGWSASRCTYFVPNNDGDVVVDRQDRLTTKVARPHRLLDGETLRYVWSVREGGDGSAASHAAVICKEARHLVALGWGVDQAVGDGRILSAAEVAALPGQRWRPWSSGRSGSRIWRIPRDGSLEDLEQAYRSFVRRIEGEEYHPPERPSRFKTVHYLTSTTMPPRFYAAFELPEGFAFRQETVNEVAAMMRSLACDCAKADTHKFPGGSETYVAGHVTKRTGETPPRFSYLPLPTIGHAHADGMIRRFLVAEPYGGNGTHARWAQQRLRNRTLRDHHGNERGILLDLWRSTSGAMLDRYVGEGLQWSTVTPVVLPGFDDGKHAKAERLLLKAIEHAGFPLAAIADLTLRRGPCWAAALHPRYYHRPNYLRQLPAWHVRLGFREPVPGPMALGAGRHCGLGIFVRSDGHE
jgi:CRISPR-associated protein Csb2